MAHPPHYETKADAMFSWMRTHTEPTRPILDQAYLARLSQFIGQSETGELLADGMIELSERLVQARSAARAGNADELGRVLHDITGTAGHLGLSAMSAEAAIAQRALTQGMQTDPALAPLLDLEDDSVSALRKYCAEVDAAAADPN